MTTTTIRDHEAVNILTDAFEVDADLGWECYNHLPWEDGLQQQRVNQTLIERGILYGCPHNCCSALSNMPFECNCIDDQPDIDDGYDEDYCDGCNQPSYACTCAELASLRRHQADPNTRGSYWVA